MLTSPIKTTRTTSALSSSDKPCSNDRRVPSKYDCLSLAIDGMPNATATTRQ